MTSSSPSTMITRRLLAARARSAAALSTCSNQPGSPAVSGRIPCWVNWPANWYWAISWVPRLLSAIVLIDPFRPRVKWQGQPREYARRAASAVLPSPASADTMT